MSTETAPNSHLIAMNDRVIAFGGGRSWLLYSKPYEDSSPWIWPDACPVCGDWMQSATFKIGNNGAEYHLNNIIVHLA